MSNSSAGLVKSDSMNTTKGRVPHNYSTFSDSLSYKKYMLLRYADYTPSFEMEGVERDEIRLNTKDIIDSLSLNSPFKGVVRKIKESFKVPYMAILPLNWDQIYTQPAVGGDVPQDANCVLENFPDRFRIFFSQLVNDVNGNPVSSTDTEAAHGEYLTALMRMLILGEYIYSKGSLLNICGYKACAQFQHLYSGYSTGSYDQFFDDVIYRVFKYVRYFRFTSNGVVRYFKGLSGVNYYGVANERYFGEFRAFLDLMREDPTGTITIDLNGTPGSLDSLFYNAVAALTTDKILDISNFDFILPPASASVPSEMDLTELNPNTLNLSRLLAYQLICFHFYTNSSIDPIYSAELYRTYVNHYWRSVYSGSEGYSKFTINGTQRNYDYLSGHLLRGQLYWSESLSQVALWSYPALAQGLSSIPDRLASFAAIFATRKSLRYGDYFVGSRPRPYAPLGTDVPVVSNYVSVIDITQRQWSQKFANAVMRSRQKIDNYVDMLFGRKPDIDWHNPLFLSREVDTVYGDEVQNTASEQATDANSRTSNLRGGLGQFTFTFHNDDMHPCVYMQIISFDIKRAYTRSVDRHFLHIDRYDMFNPMYQYIGDQPVYGIELGYPDSPANTNLSIPAVFGYQSRDMEYKQRFDVVCSGFEDNLPGWILTDADRSRNNRGVLDPDFIRNENVELDKFFLSLSGYSLGTYFHFICITQNNVFAKRAMAVDPQILG